MAAPVTVVLDRPVGTYEPIELSAVAIKVIRIPAAVYGQIAAVQVYINQSGTGPAGYYAISPDAGAFVDDATLPAARYPIGHHEHLPIYTAVNSPAGVTGDVYIAVWSTADSPDLSFAPVPVR